MIQRQEQPVWKFAFASVMVTISTLGFARMSYGILMPFMKDSLSLSYEQAGMMAAMNSIGYLAMVLFAGIMAAKWGSRRLVVFGTFMVALSLFYLGTVQSYAAGLLAMLLLGIGTAFTYTPLVNIIVGWFPHRRGFMIGFLVSGLGLGTLVSSTLVPLFTTWFSLEGWRQLWMFYGGVSLLSTLTALIILRDPPVPLLNKEQKEQSLWKEVYLHKGVLLVAVVYGLMGFAYLIPQSFLFSFMLESDLTPYRAGQIMALGGVISIFSGPLWGNISDRIGRKVALLCTLMIGTISMVVPVLFPTAAGFIAGQLLWGVTIVGMMSLIQALSTEQIHPSYAPIALGYVTIYFAAGQLLGPGLGGWIIDNVGGIPAALLLCAGLLFTAFLFTLKMSKQNAHASMSIKAEEITPS